MIQLARDRIHLENPDHQIASLATEFAARHVCRLPRFLGDELLALLDARLPGAAFTARVEDGVEVEQQLDDAPLLGLFVITLNDPRLFDFVERVTGCPPIGCFKGRVYRRGRPNGRGQFYPWHTDVVGGRLVGLSINLGRDRYEGGLLQIRNAETEAPIAEIANTGHGDAMLFRISSAIEHQVTPVTGSTPRLVLAGWFCAEPRYSDFLAARS